MSLTFNMVGGGGGGKLKDTDAVLVVTVPTGSIVTATKGGTTLTPTMWVKAADASLDCAIFSIPASQFDSTTPWTITATDGTSTASDTVLITTNQQYDVGLTYGVLYDYTTGYTVQWLQKTLSYTSLPAGQGYISFGSDGIYMRNASTATDTLKNWVTSICTPMRLDFSKFSTLNVTFEFTLDSGNNDPRFGAIDSTSGNVAKAVAYKEMPRTGTYSLDVGSITGSYYVFVEVSNAQAITVKKVWLE